jgi:predicted nucleic acid-binding protein
VIKRTTKDSDTARNAVRYMKEMQPKIFVNFDTLEPTATEIAINHSIRGADAYYLAAAVLTRSHLYTFDQQQAEAFAAISKVW